MQGAAYANRGPNSTLTTGGNPRDGTPLLKLSSPEFHADSGAAETFEDWSSLTSKSLAIVALFAWVLLRTYRGFCFMSFDAAK